MNPVAGTPLPNVLGVIPADGFTPAATGLFLMIITFSTAAVILTLIAISLMFLGGLLDGLIASSTGAIRAQSKWA